MEYKFLNFCIKFIELFLKKDIQKWFTDRGLCYPVDIRPDILRTNVSENSLIRIFARAEPTPILY